MREAYADLSGSVRKGVMPMSQDADSHLRLEVVQGVAVVGFVDEAITSPDEVQAVGDELFSLVDDQGYSRLLLNFSGVNLMSSAMLGKLMGLHKRVTAAKGHLVLCCIHPQLLEVFRITKFDRVFEIYADEPTALDRF
jgi:anti-sigma B factor antagonist